MSKANRCYPHTPRLLNPVQSLPEELNQEERGQFSESKFGALEAGLVGLHRPMRHAVPRVMGGASSALELEASKRVQAKVYFSNRRLV